MTRSRGGLGAAPGRIPAVLAMAGGALGVVAGCVELVAGPSIRSWVGDKQDTTRLGLTTMLLSLLVLFAAWSLWRGRGRSPSARLLLTVAVIVPGLVCFTTVGRLWYLPGVLLVAAGVLLMVDLRKDGSEVIASIVRNGPVALTVVLGALYVFLGATALGVAGVLGIAGGLAVFGLVAFRERLPHRARLPLLAVAALPFAVLTWWSVVTPLIALLILVVGAPALSSGGASRQAEDEVSAFGAPTATGGA